MTSAADRCQLDPAGGVLVVTRFDCDTLFRLVYMRLVHLVLSRRVSRALGETLLFVSTFTEVRTRRVISVTAFGRVEDLYRMGTVGDHIRGAKLVARKRFRTSAGIFPYGGDWRRVMFDSAVHSPSPLQDYGV
ncbi:hypothetical protein [Dactylosporangium sp. CA-139066]|uniref:hypothetical protein n=1 Tax=Dactylosporangium sp. CA-139066 TaxID=3239930 RepID=UPI003D92382E